MYLETRRAWARKRRRQRRIRNGLVALLLLAVVLLCVPLIKRLTGHDVVRLVSEQAEKERPEGILSLPEGILGETETGTQAETVTETAVELIPETVPATNPALNEEWMLILVNRHHPIPADYEVPALTELRNGNQVDSRIYPDLQQMFDDARSEGVWPYITSSYRSMEKQQSLMDSKYEEYKAEGKTDAEAKELAEAWVAIPGTSEHQLGLCVDVSSENHESQEPEIVWQWLKANAWKYGFVQRYPEDKTGVTGIINEPWHYRYVGKEAAKEMTEKGLVLEEYLQQR